jgi:uncharacterized protein (DUF1697 family)
MTIFVALLHSIVLGPDRRVVMEDLRGMAQGLGYRNPRTLVSTGNLVFETDEMRPHELEERLEEAFEESFGKHVDIIVRSDCTWMALASTNPFPDGDGSEVIVRVSRLPIDPGKVETLRPLMTDGQRMRLVGCDLWIDFHGKPSESRLLSALTTKKLGVGTLRNWNTVRGLFDMVA